MTGAALREPARLFDVAGKVAIVTGASGAFGRACAIALGALGAKLLLASGTAPARRQSRRRSARWAAPWRWSRAGPTRPRTQR
ncbi:MAG: hypothetical protein U1F45_04290 [Burkholderiales bacterium]